MTTKDARCTCAIKFIIAMTKKIQQGEDPFYQQVVLKFKEETSEVLRWEHSFE
jgi:hypothetical protein